MRRARHRRDVRAGAGEARVPAAAALPLWVIGVVLLIIVDIMGHIGKGAQRWLDLGFIRFQPSEIMKLAVPMFCAWYLHERPLPPTGNRWSSLAVIILVPAGLTILQPDLGTGGLILIGGVLLVIMAGLLPRDVQPGRRGRRRRRLGWLAVRAATTTRSNAC